MSIDPSNRLKLDYLKEAKGFAPLSYPIIDVHLHLNGARAVEIFRGAAEPYGVGRFFSMTHFEELGSVSAALGERVNFIAMPEYRRGDPVEQSGRGFIPRLRELAARGVRVVKFWAAPRRVDLARAAGRPDVLALTAPQIVEVMEAAHGLGLIFMVHVADPDTWFAAKYADQAVYGDKWSHYEPLEELLTRFDTPWIAAHMGGAPEHLDFLAGLLERHANLYLDTGAAKWMVRELSRHARGDLLDFFTRWRGRILFGSDIVTSDDHLSHSAPRGTIASSIAGKASSPQQAFNLYASRYWAYRTLFESNYEGESPIADPDLAMVAPHSYSELDAPRLRGMQFPPDLLYTLYHGAAKALFGL